MLRQSRYLAVKIEILWFNGLIVLINEILVRRQALDGKNSKLCLCVWLQLVNKMYDVPQGSINGTWLFLLNVNDITKQEIVRITKNPNLLYLQSIQF